MNASQPVQSSPGRPATSSNQTNTADQLSAANASVERLEGGLVHFDATLIRKQRLRQGAADGSSARARSSATAPTTQPVSTPPANGVAAGSGLSHSEPTATDGSGDAPASMPTPLASETPQATDSTAAPSDWWQRVMRDFSDPPTAEPAPAAQVTNTEAPAPVQAAATPQTEETPAASPTPAASQATPHALQAFLVNFVVEQTGYPEEIVEMDADLEADLGIDSIKKAQMFGEIGEHYGLQPDDSVSLDDFMTLDHVLQYLLKTLSAGESPNAGKSLHEHAPGTNGSSAGQTPIGSVGAPNAEAATVQPTDSASPSPADLKRFLVDFVVEQTGYPEEIVEMDADLEADLGIDSIKKAQMFGEIGEHYGLQPDDSVSLDDFMTLDHVLQYLLKTLSAGESPNSVKSLHEHAPGTNGSSAGQPPIGPVGASQVEATPAAAAVSPTDSASPSTADLKSFLVDFVVEQTGYPEEIVEMDADLEADLGIDSIKKAQMFGEIGEYFGLQQDENVSLDDFPTLAHVLNYLRANA